VLSVVRLIMPLDAFCLCRLCAGSVSGLALPIPLLAFHNFGTWEDEGNRLIAYLSLHCSTLLFRLLIPSSSAYVARRSSTLATFAASVASTIEHSLAVPVSFKHGYGFQESKGHLAEALRGTGHMAWRGGGVKGITAPSPEATN
jgi:hypothetical protein